MRSTSRAARRIGLLLLGLALAGPVRAADVRIGYIDSARIFTEFKDAQEAQKRFDRLVQGWRDEAAEKEKAVTQLRQEVRDQAPILSTLKRQEKEAALQRAVTEYESFIQDVWGPTGRASQENDRATTDIVQQIRAIVEKLANEKGLEIVLDATSGFLVYADRTLDLTPDVIQRLNETAKSGTGSR
jgi:outer membrane protein